MATTNPYLAFLALLPSYPLQVATITAITAVDGEVARLVLPGGGVLTARGDGAVGDLVFVRDGVIEGRAPAMPFVQIEI